MKGVSFDLADFSVSYLRKLGAEFSEARIESYVSNGVVVKNGSPELVEFDESSGLGVKFLVNGAFGFFSTDSDDKSVIRMQLEKSFRKAKSASRAAIEKIKLSDEIPVKARDFIKPKINPSDISPERKINEIKEIEKCLKEIKAKISSTYFSLSDVVTKKYFVNSNGARIESEMPTMNCYYFLTMDINGKFVQRYWQHGSVKGWEAMKEWNLEKTLVESARKLIENETKGVKAPKGKIDVITGSEVTGIIAHESGGHPYEADRILGREAAQAGESFVSKDFAGTKMGKEVVNVVDDPTIAASYGYYKYDDEGIKARRKYLIKNGKVLEFMHNRETAGKIGIKSNASARASSYNREPIIRMSNTFFLPGKQKFDELVKGIKKGIYIKNFNEWNIDDTRLNQKYVGSECYLIENGKITKPVKSPIIEMNTFRLYSSIDAVSKDRFELHAATCGKGEPMQGMPVMMGGSCLRIRNIRLGNHQT